VLFNQEQMSGIIIAAITICKQQKQTGIKAVHLVLSAAPCLAGTISTPALFMLRQ